MDKEKAIEVVEKMISVFDEYIKEMNTEIDSEKERIIGSNHRLTVLNVFRKKAEDTRTLMLEHQPVLSKEHY